MTNQSTDPKPATKRLFIGIPVAVNSSLEAAIKRTRINADRKDMEFYWSPPENYHVTLNFLGPVALDRISAVERVLSTVAAEHAPLHTKLRGMGGFPDERHVRALYIGVRKSRALDALQAHLAEALDEIGFAPEAREYSPHLTIGRLRKTRAVTDLISPYVRTAFGSIDINDLVLFESLMHGGHSVYRPLSRYALTGAPRDLGDEAPIESED